jgi:heterodisulfide reductase subunit C2
MSSGTHHRNHADTLAGRIEEATGVKLAHCYQCGKCAAGCLVSDQMDVTSCQALRMLQYGLPEMDMRVLRSEGIWLCLSCETCSARCPQDVEIPKVVDFLRGEAVRLGVAHPGSKDILAFHRAFLDSIEHTGRLYEVGLVADYKLRSRHFLKDVMLAPKMYFKGKLGLFPHLIKDRKGMKALFQRATGKE